MKKKYLLFGLMAKSLLSFGQKNTAPSVYRKQKLREVAVQTLCSYYTQDGNHSAVTGGKGTEELSVFAPEVAVTYRADSMHTLSFNAGADIITSASTDKIDYVISSASRRDVRSHINLGYNRRFGHSGITAGISTGLSVESDYTSLPVGLSFAHINADASREIQVQVQGYFDDLRWGRLNKNYHRPVRLIYPVELRYKEWYDTYRRTSYNLSISVSQVINRRIVAVLTPGLVYQKGLLSTPFHRVYFRDDFFPRVEYLPSERWKVPVGLQVNIFAARRIILRTYYRFYYDNIGIKAHTLQLEVPVKITPLLTVAPHFRWYTQTASSYFRPFKEHENTESFYTSDYDLSAFNSYKTGITLRYAPQAGWRHYLFSEAGLRYAWYRRSDGLQAHTFSLLLDFKYSRIKR